MKLSIPKPCHENWDAMTPNEKGRFCQVCSKTVRDFTSSSDQEIIDSLSGNSNVCVNVTSDQLNRNLNYSFINSLFAKFAVGFVLTSGGMITVNAQKTETKKDTVALKSRGEISKAQSIKKDTVNIQDVVVGKVAYNDSQKIETLYILDGQIIDEDIMRNIDSKNIDRIEVLKDASATALYGAKGKNGVIVITSKKKDKK